MKKYLSLLIIVLSVFIFNIVSAEESATGVNTRKSEVEARIKSHLEAAKESRQEVRSETKAKIQEVRKEAKEKMEEFKEKAKEIKDQKKQEIFKKIVDSRMKVFDGLNQVLENITKREVRLKEQVLKTKALGKDVVQEEANLVKMESKLAEAKSKINEAANLLSSSTNTLTKADKLKLKELVASIHSDFKEVKDLIRETVKTLKDKIKETSEEKESKEDSN